MYLFPDQWALSHHRGDRCSTAILRRRHSTIRECVSSASVTASAVAFAERPAQWFRAIALCWECMPSRKNCITRGAGYFQQAGSSYRVVLILS